MNVYSDEFIELAFGKTALARELDGLGVNDTLSAAKLLTLTDGVSDDVMEELFDHLHGLIGGFDLSDFPKGMSGEAARRLREEEQLVKSGDLLSGLVYVLLAGGSVHHFLIYGVGNLLSLAVLILFKLCGKERIRKEGFLAVVFAIAVQLLMQLGRAAVAGLFGFSAAECLGFITTDVLSILFTVFIVWTVRRIEGLFEDQKNYLLRIQREQKVERGEQF